MAGDDARPEDLANAGTEAADREPYGVLIVGIATRTNLERHVRPSARFLLEPGELPTLFPDLEPIDHVEQWTPSGVHEAWYAGKRRPNHAARAQSGA